MEEKKATFQFLGFRIVKSEISLPKDALKNHELHIEIEQNNGILNGVDYTHNMTVGIYNDDRTINIHVSAEGFFKFTESVSNVSTFTNVNAPAILFPYVRAYVSALTALSGIEPITLPTLNLSNRE